MILLDAVSEHLITKGYRKSSDEPRHAIIYDYHHGTGVKEIKKLLFTQHNASNVVDDYGEIEIYAEQLKYDATTIYYIRIMTIQYYQNEPFNLHYRLLISTDYKGHNCNINDPEMFNKLDSTLESFITTHNQQCKTA